MGGRHAGTCNPNHDAAALLLFAAPASAQVARMELHTFLSTTISDPEFLIGKKDGKAVTLAGELRLLRAGLR
jgi:hypothetical protein